MKSLVSTADKKTERAFLVGVELKSQPKWELQDSLEELGSLASTAGAEIIGNGSQRLEKPFPATLIGTGKADEFADFCRDNKADTVIFDDELSPAQSRNLEKIFECKVLDRTSLILDIFAQRARTREGKLQIELAQLQHLLPRLTRFWTHLSRQKGGIGMRGDGETQLESDRRRVQERIHRISLDLKSVQRQRATQRDGRRRTLWPTASLVGYTNAGKSTLFNALTGADVLQEDKLFATLDPTTRRLRLPTNQNVLLSDTVGFIRKLPHSLVDSFKATLEEVVQSDLLLHVVDVSHPQAEEQISVVNRVLNELGAGDKPTMMVFNKSDRLEDGEFTGRLADSYPDAVRVSALRQTGFDDLMRELGTRLRPVREFVDLAVPHSRTDVIARLHKVGEVVEIDYDGPETSIRAGIPPYVLNEFASFIKAEVEA